MDTITKPTNRTLILENIDYNPDALEEYEKFSHLIFGLDSKDDWDQVTTLVVRLGYKLNENFLDNFPSLKRIVSPTTGVDHIDLEYCNSRAVTVFSLSDVRSSIANITSTAEISLGLIVSLARKQQLSVSSVMQDAVWNRELFRTRQLSNLTLGIIGFGRIGSILGNYTIPIFKSVLVHDSNPDTKKMSDLGLSNITLQEVLENSDLVSLHVTPNKSGLPVIGRTELGFMKNGSMLINTARGSVIDEARVAEEIQSGRLAGYACDVLSGEPFNGNELTASPIWQAAKSGYNVIISPHIGGCTTDAMAQTELSLAQHVANKVLGDDERP